MSTKKFSLLLCGVISISLICTGCFSKKNIEPENSVVFVRNFWPYLKDDNARIGLLNKLYNQLAPGSLMIIGNFDRVGTDYAINEMIEKVGFRPTSVEYVYEKIEVDKVK